MSILERRCFFLRILERRNQAHHLHFYILVILVIVTRTLALTTWNNIFVKGCHCWTQYLGISDYSCVFENTNMKHHLPGRWVPLVAVFRALVVGTRRVAVRFLNSSTLSARFEPFQTVRIHVIQIGFQPQAISGVGVDCICRPGWVGEDCSQRGELAEAM